MSGLSELKLCVDRIVPPAFRLADAALEEASADAADALAELAPIDADDPIGRTRAALVVVKRWPNGRTVRCRFLDGDDVQRRRVEEKAHIWERDANIRFEFVRSTDEDIRISFSEDGSWSALGIDALNERYFPRHQPTMNYGWLTADSADDEYNRVVVHEFGHALGLIHEHQSPSADLEWNEDEVYRRYSGSPNFWSREEIDFNILRRYSAAQTQFSTFDPDSIMLYAFPPELFDNWQGTHFNTQQSETDKRFIAAAYPKPTPERPRTLRLRDPLLQGDDVTALQEQLNELGFGPLNVDGIYGPVTATAVRRFQRANDLRADGVYGPRTRGVLTGLLVPGG